MLHQRQKETSVFFAVVGFAFTLSVWWGGYQGRQYGSLLLRRQRRCTRCFYITDINIGTVNKAKTNKCCYENSANSVDV